MTEEGIPRWAAEFVTRRMAPAYKAIGVGVPVVWQHKHEAIWIRVFRDRAHREEVEEAIAACRQGRATRVTLGNGEITTDLMNEMSATARVHGFRPPPDVRPLDPMVEPRFTPSPAQEIIFCEVASHREEDWRKFASSHASNFHEIAGAHTAIAWLGPGQYVYVRQWEDVDRRERWVRNQIGTSIESLDLDDDATLRFAGFRDMQSLEVARFCGFLRISGIKIVKPLLRPAF